MIKNIEPELNSIFRKKGKKPKPLIKAKKAEKKAMVDELAKLGVNPSQMHCLGMLR